jgi:competence protein ComEC
VGMANVNLSLFFHCFFTLPVAVALSLTGLIHNPAATLTTRVTACDIGQGDAILLQHGTLTVLIDTGPDSAILKCLSQELPWWRPKIDILILSHSDWDHIGGVESVLQFYQVGEVWHTKWSQMSESGERVEKALQDLPTRMVQAGDTLQVPGWRIRVLSGDVFYENVLSLVDLEDNPNNRSLAIWAIGESFGFLGLGDLECPGELAVVGVSLLNTVQILKVSHHGSKTSTCEDFVRRIQPETAIVSAGKGNSYGHPHPLPLENLQKMGVFVLKTDENGTFTLDHSMEGWRVQRKMGEQVSSQALSSRSKKW